MLRRDASLHSPHRHVHSQHARAGRGVRALPSLPHEGVPGPVQLARAHRVEAAEDGAHAEQQQQAAAADGEPDEQHALPLAVGAVVARPAVVAAAAGHARAVELARAVAAAAILACHRAAVGGRPG